MLRSENQVAAAQAAGTLWNLCVEDDTNKQRVGETGAIPHLIALLHAPDPFTQSQAVGALSECSLGQVIHTSLLVHCIHAREEFALGLDCGANIIVHPPSLPTN